MNLKSIRYNLFKNCGRLLKVRGYRSGPTLNERFAPTKTWFAGPRFNQIIITKSLFRDFWWYNIPKCTRCLRILGISVGARANSVFILDLVIARNIYKLRLSTGEQYNNYRIIIDRLVVVKPRTQVAVIPIICDMIEKCIVMLSTVVKRKIIKRKIVIN